MINRRLPRWLYVILNIGGMMISVISRFINAAFFGGSTYQSLSARAHMEDWRLQFYINAIFFWEDDHCKAAWESEVDNARKTLQRAGLQ